VAILAVFKPADIDRTALAGFAWGVVACAAYDLFRLPSVYVFHLWGDFFGRIGGWATGTNSKYLAGYLWRYLGDGAGIGVVVFIQAAVIGVASWPRRHVVGFTVAFAIFPVWTGLVLTDALAPTGRAFFPLTATTLALSLVGHLIFGAMLGYGLWVSQHRAKRGLSPANLVSCSIPSNCSVTGGAGERDPRVRRTRSRAAATLSPLLRASRAPLTTYIGQPTRANQALTALFR